MIRGGWVTFASNPDANAVRFDILGDPPQFLRIRDRSRDDSRGRDYIVIDLITHKVIEGQTEYRQKNGTKKG
jgi:hypothetical protein